MKIYKTNVSNFWHFNELMLIKMILVIRDC